MNKKWAVGIAGVLLSCTLAACGSKTVATTNGGKITESEYYSSMKNTSNGKAVLQQMILNKVLNKEYGNKVSDSDVNKQVNTYKKMYGKQFEPMLQQQGLTLASLKDQLKSNLLIKAAIKENTKISDKDLQNQFKSFQPKVTVNEILVSSKSDAEKVISQLKDGKKFSDLAKKYSKDSSNKNNGGR